MRVLICGSRNLNNKQFVNSILDKLEAELGPWNLVIQGEARGADTLAREWAEDMKISVMRFPANWKLHGKAAGPIRNKQMLDKGKPDLVIAFLAPGSRGTKNMIDQARKAGIKTHIVELI